MIIATIILFIAIGYLIFLLFGYKLVLMLLTWEKPILRVDDIPPVSLVVPAFNEEKNIARKIENLQSLDYPQDKIQILVVDNSSTDGTHQIASSYPVTVLESPRGKINAINAGLTHARSDIIIVSDADTVLKPDAVKSLVTCFANNLVGAVGGKAIVEDNSSFFGQSKMRYHEADWNLRTLEGRLDSAISLDGKLMAFRKSLLPSLSPESVVDDLEITFRLRSQGYRSIIDDHAVVYEVGPQTLKAELKQIRRRVALTIPVLFNYIHMLLNPRYGWFGMLIFPIRRMLAVLSPLMYLYIVCYLLLWSWKTAVAAGIIVSFGIIFTGHYFPLIQQAGIILGWLDVLSARVRASAQWEKVN